MEENTQLPDWRTDITPSRATLKIKDGENVIVTFQDEGVKKESKDFGTSIAFAVTVSGESETKTFYVKANNFDMLGQIKELGKLTGLKCAISRTGTKKSDTRYRIVKVQ